MEKYLDLKEKVSFSAKFMGINVLDKDYKIGIATYFTYLMLFLSNMSSIHTIIDAFPDFIVILQALTTYGMIAQV